MGVCLGRNSAEATHDERLADMVFEFEKPSYKLLLLGAASGGKTTFLSLIKYLFVESQTYDSQTNNEMIKEIIKTNIKSYLLNFIKNNSIEFENAFKNNQKLKNIIELINKNGLELELNNINSQMIYELFISKKFQNVLLFYFKFGFLICYFFKNAFL